MKVARRKDAADAAGEGAAGSKRKTRTPHNNMGKNDFFPAARPQNNQIIQLLKIVMMPKLNFFRAHGLPIRFLQGKTT
jgi:hypothetical protein